MIRLIRNCNKSIISMDNGEMGISKLIFVYKPSYFNIQIILLFSLILAILFIPSVFSLGITPGRTTLNYAPGLEREIEFSVLNTEHKNMQILLTVQGELNRSIELNSGIFDISSNEGSKSFKYKFKIPDKIEKSPGLHTAEIIALEVPKANEKGTYVGATVAVISQLYLQVPYPGKYIEADLNIMDSESNGTATFIVPVINRGKVGVGEVRALIDIYDKFNEKVGTIETDYFYLGPGARTELVGKWNVSVPSGSYLAKVSVFYDGESKNFERQFGVGIQMLSIESILVSNFKLGEIAKLQILVENRWNQELKSVSSNLIVYNKDSQIMADVKSADERVPALSKKELVAYWDTVGVSEGDYSGKLMVRYGEKSSDKNLVLKVSENSLNIIGVGYAIRPEGGKGINITNILIILVVLLIIVNVSWFIYFYRFRNVKVSKKVKRSKR
jgi:hypothetical protein